MIITLLTDFGLSDPYVGVMKGIIAGVAPESRCIDLTHCVTHQDVRQAGFLLSGAAFSFPSGSIHLAVVDPGVGTDRRPILAKKAGHWFIAPDNGLLAWVLKDGWDQLVELDNPDYWQQTQSTTFHGRDIFAPAAGHLARGVPVGELGSEIEHIVTLECPEVEIGGNDSLTGEILHVDHFGNCITNIPGASVSRRCRVEAGTSTVIPHVSSTYADAGMGEPVAVVGSSGYLEIAVRNNSAAEMLGLERGDRVKLVPRRPESGPGPG